MAATVADSSFTQYCCQQSIAWNYLSRIFSFYSVSCHVVFLRLLNFLFIRTLLLMRLISWVKSLIIAGCTSKWSEGCFNRLTSSQWLYICDW